MSAPSSPGRPRNPLEAFTSGGWFKGLLRLALGVALVTVVLTVAGGDSWQHLRHPKLLPLIALGALVHLVQRVARIRKWQQMLVPTEVMQRSFGYLLRVQLIGMVANLLLPVSEAVKVWAVSNNRDDARVATQSIVIDMSMHTCLIGVVGVVSAVAANWWEPALWVVSLTMLLLPLLVIGVARRWPQATAIVDDAPRLWLLALVETACQVSIYAIAFNAIGVPITTVQLLALAPVLYIVDLLNFTPSGLGLREALFGGVLQVMPNVSADVGIAAALVISSMLLLATLVGGGLALVFPSPAPDA